MSRVDIANALRKALPAPNPVVDFYLSQGVWDQAIHESLATFVDEKAELPSDIHAAVVELVDHDGIAPKFKRRVMFHLDRIPTASANE